MPAVPARRWVSVPGLQLAASKQSALASRRSLHRSCSARLAAPHCSQTSSGGGGRALASRSPCLTPLPLAKQVSFFMHQLLTVPHSLALPLRCRSSCARAPTCCPSGWARRSASCACCLRRRSATSPPSSSSTKSTAWRRCGQGLGWVLMPEGQGLACCSSFAGGDAACWLAAGPSAQVACCWGYACPTPSQPPHQPCHVPPSPLCRPRRLLQVRSSKQDQIHNSIVSTLLALMDGLDARGQVGAR